MLNAAQSKRLRFVTGGTDNGVTVWQRDEGKTEWHARPLGGTSSIPPTPPLAHSLPLSAHTDWVRDVAWAPTLSGVSSVIASCSQVSL